MGELIPCNISSQHIIEYFDTLQMFNMSQYNGEKNVNGRLLDIVFCNDFVSVSESKEPLALPIDSHHKPLLLQTKFTKIHQLIDKPMKRYIFSKGDYDAIKAELDLMNWTQILRSVNLKDAVTIFYKVLYKLRDKYTPIKTFKKSSNPPWYTPALIKIIKEKYKYHRKSKQYKNLSDYNSFSILRSRAIELEKNCYEKYIEKIEASIVKSPKSFWTYVKSKRVMGAFPNVMHYGESSADTGEVICDLFARYFKSTFLEPELSADGECASCELYSGTAMSVSTVDINHLRILKLLKSLDLTKSGGLELIPPIFIVNCADSLAEPLCILFKRSLTEVIVPKV